MQPRHVEALVVRGDELRLDLVERHRRGVDDPRAGRAIGQQLLRHERAGVEADRAARDQIAAAHGDEVGRARPRADEMHGHGASPVIASAQVAGPTATRGASSRAPGPPAASAAASETDGTPVSASTRSDRVTARAPAASKSACGTTTSFTPRSDAAAAMPGSPPFADEVAIMPSASAAEAGAVERRGNRRLDLAGRRAGPAAHAGDDHGLVQTHCVTGMAGRHAGLAADRLGARQRDANELAAERGVARDQQRLGLAASPR